MTPPIAITLTIKIHPPVSEDLDDTDRFAEEIRDEVQSALPNALGVELDDWTRGGGESW
jgi:hypothetical protein